MGAPPYRLWIWILDNIGWIISDRGYYWTSELGCEYECISDQIIKVKVKAVTRFESHLVFLSLRYWHHVSVWAVTLHIFSRTHPWRKIPNVAFTTLLPHPNSPQKLAYMEKNAQKTSVPMGILWQETRGNKRPTEPPTKVGISPKSPPRRILPP
jgi:hypothetical protein